MNPGKFRPGPKPTMPVYPSNDPRWSHWCFTSDGMRCMRFKTPTAAKSQVLRMGFKPVLVTPEAEL